MLKITDITVRSEEFSDLKDKEVKVIILDGNTGKVSLVHMPEHGEAAVEMRRGVAYKVTYRADNLL